MAQSTLSLSGSYTLQPPSFPPSAAQQVGSPISEVNFVQHYRAEQIDLVSDAQAVIAFPPGMTACHFMYFRVQGGSPITMTVVASGASAAFPVDPLVVQYFNNRPLSAIAVQRAAGVPTTLTYVIAQNQ